MKKIGLVVAVVCCLGAVVACGGNDVNTVCEKEAECATKAGDAFSKTQCEDQLTQESEKAQTAGCSAEYQVVADCVASATASASCTDLADLGAFVSANCGAQVKKLETCLGQ